LGVPIRIQNAQDNQISRFTSEHKEPFAWEAGVCITTYTMIAFSGRRSEEAARVMEQIQEREWGLLLLDEVHVVPAQMFRKVRRCSERCTDVQEVAQVFRKVRRCSGR
jgi:DNA excision repair protein ERCC-3